MTGAQNPPPSNFRRLVLCCIKSDFHKQICVGKRFTRSTQSMNKASCASGNLKKKNSKIVQNLQIFEEQRNFAEMLADFRQNSTTFCWKFCRSTSAAMCAPRPLKSWLWMWMIGGSMPRSLKTRMMTSEANEY